MLLFLEIHAINRIRVKVRQYFFFLVFVLLLITQDILPLFLIERYFYIFNSPFPGNILACLVLLTQFFVTVGGVLLFGRSSVILSLIALLANFFIVFTIYINGWDVNLILIMGVILTNMFTVVLVANFKEKTDIIKRSLIVSARTDYLTGARNLPCMEHDLNMLVKKRAQFALMLINLDSFKHINEVRGYKCGNEVLKVLVSRWKKAFENVDGHVYRINGDEFAIVFKNYESRKALNQAIDKVSSAVKSPVFTGKYENYLSACAGMVEYPSNASQVEQLRQYADAALSSAKKELKVREKFRLCTFNADTLKKVERNLFISDLLQKAVVSNLLYLNFQPQYEAGSKKLHGFECLVRLRDFEGNEISPEEFIPIAESRGFIYDIGQWVLENGMNAFKTALDNASGMNKDVTISLNISSVQFMEDSFIESCAEIVRRSQLDIKNIVFELTESVLMSSPEKAFSLIEKLNKDGVSFSIDDFGTGYSSLSYIYKFNFKELKLDKSFTDMIGRNKRNDDFIRGVINMCHRFGIKVVTEGVESEAQYSKLLSDGCDIIQGYYFSRPVDEKRMSEMLLD